MNNIPNEIASRDTFYGIFSTQLSETYDNEQYIVTTLALCVLVEQSVKQAADMINGRFYEALIKLDNEKKITQEEYDAINFLRNIRNAIFHENIHSTAITYDEILYTFDENETYGEFLDRNFSMFLDIVKKLLVC